MHKGSLCHHAVSVRPSVRVSVTFVDHVKTHKRIFEFFSPSGGHTILVIPYQMGWRYSDWTPLTGASNAGGVGKKRDSGRISGFAAYGSTVLSTVRVAKYEIQSRDERRQASSIHRSVRRRSVVHTRGRRSVCDGLDVIRRRRREVQPPLVITPVFCCRRTS